MPLSEYEQRVLAQMERQLSSDDPKLAETFAKPRAPRQTRRIAAGIVMFALGIGALVGGVALSMSWLGVVGFAVMFGGVMIGLSRGSAPAGEASKQAAPQSQSSTASKSSFMNRMEDRWDRRRRDGR